MSFHNRAHLLIILPALFWWNWDDASFLSSYVTPAGSTSRAQPTLQFKPSHLNNLLAIKHAAGELIPGIGFSNRGHFAFFTPISPTSCTGPWSSFGETEVCTKTRKQTVFKKEARKFVPWTRRALRLFKYLPEVFSFNNISPTRITETSERSDVPVSISHSLSTLTATSQEVRQRRIPTGH